MAVQSRTFGAIDYIVCAIMLLISIGIGIYYAIVDRKRQNVQEYMMAGKKMHFLPVAFSLLASFISAIALLGTPAEIYLYGMQFSVVVISFFLVMAAAAHLYVPIFYKMNVISAYEYLEQRFSYSVRWVSSLAFCTQMVIYMAIVLYAPALALNAVTGLNWLLAASAIGLSCTFYTTLGGMKAVLWTDTFQTFIMFGGVITVLIAGTIRAGGLANVWEISMSGKRLEFFNMSPDPLTRHSFWTMIVGGFFMWLAVYGVNQAQVQRALSCRTLRHAQIAYWLNSVGLSLIILLCCFTGLVIYAYYATCDPLQTNQISKYDQIVPFFVMEILNDAPGIPGLFVASVFSGALSSLSSGINSIAAVIQKDLIPHRWISNFSHKADTLLSKGLALLLGLVTSGLSFVVHFAPRQVLQISLSLGQAVGCPVLGVYTLGMCCPWANSLGALTGLICSLTTTLLMTFGAIISNVPIETLPLNTTGCAEASNMTNLQTTGVFMSEPMSVSISTISSVSTSGLPVASAEQHSAAPFWLFRVSYMWYGLIGFSIVFLVGNVVTVVTNLCGFGDNYKQPDAQLLWPMVQKCFPRYIKRISNHPATTWKSQKSPTTLSINQNTSSTTTLINQSSDSFSSFPGISILPEGIKREDTNGTGIGYGRLEDLNDQTQF